MVSPFVKQTWTVTAVLINMVGQGMLLSYSSCLLPALQSPDSPIKTDLHTASWISSLGGVSMIPGFLVSSTLMDLYGRKKAHALGIVPGVLCWLTIHFANDVPALMIGRVLCGITAGSTVSLGAAIIGEYSAPKYRGMFLNLKTASVCLAALIVHILSRFYHWRTIALHALIPHFIALLMIFTWSESPAWLITKKQYEESEKVFYSLRGRSEETSKEIEAMIEAHIERMLQLPERQSVMNKIMKFLKKFTKREILKPMFVVCLGAVLIEMCGRHLFPAYAIQIIDEITVSKSQSFYYTLCTDLIITTTSLCSSVLVKVMKRRTILFSTGFAAFLVLMIVCIYLFLVARNLITKDYPWIPVSLFVVYFILVNLGCTPIPLAFLGELYPLAHREVGLAFSGVWISLCMMLSLHITPHLLISCKVYGTFAIYGIVMGISLVILYFTLPETKDRTLQDIEDYFSHGKYLDTVSGDMEARVKMMVKV